MLHTCITVSVMYLFFNQFHLTVLVVNGSTLYFRPWYVRISRYEHLVALSVRGLPEAVERSDLSNKNQTLQAKYSRGIPNSGCVHVRICRW